jgi:putative flippase GtrA
MDRLKRSLRTKSDKTSVQLVRYAFVAGIGLAVDFGLLVLLTEAGMHYLTAATIAFVVALVVNYVLSMLWVFPRSRHSRWREFGMFGAIGLVGLGLNDLLMWVLTSGLGMHYVLSKAVTTGLVFTWNFIARKSFFAAAPADQVED